tara:strand:+ start:661 stop:1758 length:1098 start_codon:yes stop_codon:yes gene_type:complete
MAFAKASGYTNLNSGNFSPVIYSKKVQKAFRKSSVVEDISNTDYFGEISSFGDSVRIIKEPDITITSYARGTTLATQDLVDADFSMIINQANYFQFALDDIEEAHSHVNWIELSSDKAAFNLRDTFDSEVLGHMSGWTGGAGSWARRTALETGSTKADSNAGNDELLAANHLDITDFGGAELAGANDGAGQAGTAGDPTSIPVAATSASGGVSTPLEIINRMARIMDTANVDTEGRWFVADPVFYEILMDENSKFINNDYTDKGTDILRNGKVTNGLIRGFRMYKSNNLPYDQNGPGHTSSTGSEHSYGVIIAGHNSAVATAQQINKTETFRSPNTFSDIVRGLQLYGRKILRPESIVTAIYNTA